MIYKAVLLECDGAVGKTMADYDVWSYTFSLRAFFSKNK
jgi:hypothetical protein